MCLQKGLNTNKTAQEIIERAETGRALARAEAEAFMEELLSGRVETPEIVRMLVVGDLQPAIRFTLLKNLGVAWISGGERLEAEHGAQRQRSGTERTIGHLEVHPR